MCPPATSSRPSARNAWPAQKNRSGLGTAVKALVAGFQTRGVPCSPQESTRPFGSRLRWTATTGH